MFTKGDKVILLDNYNGAPIESQNWAKRGGLEVGGEYTVKRVEGEKRIYIEECKGGYIHRQYRFEKVGDKIEWEEF